jgi:hypothetical protein
MEFRWSLHHFGEAKALALLYAGCQLEYHQRVAQENATFTLTHGSGLEAQLGSLLPRLVEEIAKACSPSVTRVSCFLRVSL